MNTLTKHQRLKKPADFQRVYTSKQWGSSKHFTFNVLSNDSPELLNNSSETSVFGVTVSKKVSKRAVDRNRIKRQVREFYRLRQDELLQAQVVVTARPSCLNATDDERLESLNELWIKLMKWQRWHDHQQQKQPSLD